MNAFYLIKGEHLTDDWGILNERSNGKRVGGSIAIAKWTLTEALKSYP